MGLEERDRRWCREALPERGAERVHAETVQPQRRAG